MDIVINGKIYTAADYEQALENIEELMNKETRNDDELFELIELAEIAEKYEEINWPIGEK